MTDLLERALATLRGLPPEVQDDIARVMLQLAGEEPSVYVMTPEEEASFDTARAQAARREFASDEQMQAIWAKHGL